MTQMASSDNRAGRSAGAGRVDLELEAVVIPVSDVDRAKEFYGRLGRRLDADFSFDNGFPGVHLTPPGSSASIQFGRNKTSAAPGSAQGLYLLVSDIEAARDERRVAEEGELLVLMRAGAVRILAVHDARLVRFSSRPTCASRSMIAFAHDLGLVLGFAVQDRVSRRGSLTPRRSQNPA